MEVNSKGSPPSRRLPGPTPSPKFLLTLNMSVKEKCPPSLSSSRNEGPVWAEWWRRMRELPREPMVRSSCPSIQRLGTVRFERLSDAPDMAMSDLKRGSEATRSTELMPPNDIPEAHGA